MARRNQSQIINNENISYDDTTNYFSTCKLNVFNFILHLRPLIMFYLGWVFLHYICSQFYIYYCVPYTWYGILISPFLSMTPHCYAFRWVIHESGTIFYTMWISIGMWFTSKLIPNK